MAEPLPQASAPLATCTEDLAGRIKITYACPHCGRKSTIPNEVAIKLGAAVITRMRKDHHGKPPVFYCCPCGNFVGTARELRSHRCTLKPPRGKERDAGLLATRAQVIAYYARRGQPVPAYIPLDEYA